MSWFGRVLRYDGLRTVTATRNSHKPRPYRAALMSRCFFEPTERASARSSVAVFASSWMGLPCDTANTNVETGASGCSNAKCAQHDSLGFRV